MILIGRGANLITRTLQNVLHVRLVGSLEKRVERLRRFYDLSKKAALELIRREDRGRRRCLKKYFGADPEDPLLYHLVVNTDLFSYEHAAGTIGSTVLSRGWLSTVPPAESQGSHSA